jgi:uncharacterized protein with HEPN domain
MIFWKTYNFRMQQSEDRDNSEASKNIPEEFKRQYPDVPWSEMARTRDKLIHGYFGVDLELTWAIIQDDLPELKEKVNKILEKLK